MMWKSLKLFCSVCWVFWWVLFPPPCLTISSGAEAITVLTHWELQLTVVRECLCGDVVMTDANSVIYATGICFCLCGWWQLRHPPPPRLCVFLITFVRCQTIELHPDQRNLVVYTIYTVFFQPPSIRAGHDFFVNNAVPVVVVASELPAQVLSRLYFRPFLVLCLSQYIFTQKKI